MGKVFQISIYSILLILVFLVFGTILKSCGSSAVDTMADTADEVTENITKAGGEVIAKAESTIDNVAEEFEGDDIDFSDTKSESKSFGDNMESDDDDSPSYVKEDAPVYNPPEDVVKAPTQKVVEEKKPTKKATSSSSGSRGNYLLITGNYSQESNAKAMVKKLKNKGFSNAEFVIFEGSRYYTVIAGKYSSMSTANSAKQNLGGIDAYVQKKRT